MHVPPLWVPLTPSSLEQNVILGSLPSVKILTVLSFLPAFSYQPQTPHLEEDLKEVLRSEAGIELIIEDDVKPEKQKRKQGVS